MSKTRLKGRYEKRGILGEGGMGIVYRAFDVEVPREVALKTIREVHDPAALEFFRRECTVLAKLQHPNIVDLYDFGDFEEHGEKKPYFVMPLLPGLTLDKLIHNPSLRLTVERVIEIITQACRGLQAAHDRGLVHRDIKPSNIFVLEDDSVKLIDFGVAHLVGNRTTTGLKGTLFYMSPEQIEMGQPTSCSDIFSMAVVCYEALTRRRPFTGAREDEIAKAILHQIPPPATDLNPAVGLGLSQVLHAAMAKKAIHRTPTVRQFAEELQKALRKQPIERFDPVRNESRIRRAQRAVEDSEYDFAGEILVELEAEGHLHPQIRSLRQQVDSAVREKLIRQLVDSARRRLQDEEYQLALQKIEEVLRIDRANEEALSLRTSIEGKHKTQQIENWLHLAEQHIANHAYELAREALQNVLKVKPTDTQALQLVSRIDEREQEYVSARKEKEEIFRVALDYWQRGEVSAALSKLELVLELDRQAPDTSEAAGPYQSLYNEVRSESDAIKNAHTRARQLISESNFAGARSICEEYLQKYPDNALFQALKFDIGERERQSMSAYIAQIDRDSEAEPDLDRKVAILNDALKRYPLNPHFEQALKVITDRRDLVNSIVQKARNLEDRGQYAEALNQWEILGTIYSLYPGLDYECDRVVKRRDHQVRSDNKTRWIEQIDRLLNVGDFNRAVTLLKTVLAEFPGDEEIATLDTLARTGAIRSKKAIEIFETAQEMCAKGEMEAGIEAMWRAHKLAEYNSFIRAVLVENLLKYASLSAAFDPHASEVVIGQALELDPTNSQAKNLRMMLEDRQKDLAVEQCLSRSRQLQATGDPKAALAEIEQLLDSFPSEPRLLSRQAALFPLIPESPIAPTHELKADLVNQRGRSVPDAETWALTSPHNPDWSADSSEKSDIQLPDPVLSTPVNQQTDSAVPPIQPVVEGSAPPAKSRSTALVVAVLVFVLVAIGGFAAWRHLRALAPPTTSTAAFEAEFDVRASIPDAHVFVNGTDRGPSPAHLKLSAGEYQIDAVLSGYKSAGPMKLVVQPDMVVAPIEIALQPVTEGFSLSADTKSQNREAGFARFSVTPPQSSITWQLDGGTETGSAKEGERISLPPGRYLVTVSADQYKVRQETITIASGADVSFDWSLSPADAPHAPLPAPNARSVGFEALEGNLANDGEGWFVSKSRFTLLKNSEAGVFYFNMRFPGVLRKRAFWVVNYQNEKNYVQFEIDEKNITMSVVADGQTREGKPVPHQLVKYDYYYTLSVQVDQHQVIFGGLQNGSYTRFYNWTSPTDNLIERRFGFRGDVALNGFRFQASQ